MIIMDTNALTKQYGTQVVVNKLNMNVKKGEIYALLGRNGAGKTTTLRMIMGLLKPTSGEVRIFGEKLNTNNSKVFQRIGALIEAPSFYENLTAQENLELIASLRGIHNENAINSALILVGLECENKKKVGKFSLGMKQRLGIALALMHEPELIILDEPTNALDPIGIQQIRVLIRDLCNQKNTTFLISSHILSEVEQLADRIGIIEKGNLLEETYMDDIGKYNRHYVKMAVSNAMQTIPILESKLGIFDFEIEDDNTLKIYEIERDMAEVNRVLNNASIGVSEISMNKGNLEEYFIRVTGGHTIG
ncbi:MULTISPECIES: ABC transporter ATP-binding protein [Clostridium]|uniref:ABC transporter ATP-binding protein n=1 Tax=Clostridium TaxID=1485 RepID=UPI00051C91A4|nr:MULTISPECIES: ABC transporter ATP-binding protein [Clostridium]UZT08651.1 ABC transporter ATP-binding protein [Clostridium sp. LQ25]AXB87058.1 ABC transporter ATP-binding protein [Clostridium butyricum]KIU04940.1 bacitracin ABC superfamily ATP binding cassette transporter, ABC protein [Clostridium butyricum]KJZ85840.1 Bacitracin transport ATP-binding protein bcrA [Clostridium sp. IBUN22A]KJZ88750.1 Bacitracin transport ATP-binding protein bcrA [Clostridium sp. IBUN125C]